MRKRHHSTGEMISTLTFIGVGLWCLGTGLEAPPLKATVLFICAGACITGAARNLIAKALSRD
ncbi:hypothetical protein [Roseovarius aquimarinus]|uniref:Uncharacterized protein n=1 Tax=Roseovarius aquimarinus TaxID=1229156 RepID=A0ABW7I5W2_9RHOB